jgi:hypothetical protein
MNKIRTDRKPKDTPLEMHQLLDKQFQKRFGIKARSNSLFCYFRNINSYLRDRSGYGVPYYIFPIGNFKTI